MIEEIAVYGKERHQDIRALDSRTLLGQVDPLENVPDDALSGTFNG